MSDQNSTPIPVDLMEHVSRQAQDQGKVPAHYLSHLARINAYLAQLGHTPAPELLVQRTDVGMFHGSKSRPAKDLP